MESDVEVTAPRPFGDSYAATADTLGQRILDLIPTHPFGCESPYCGCHEHDDEEPRCDFCGDTATARYGEFQVCAHHYEDSFTQAAR